MERTTTMRINASLSLKKKDKVRLYALYHYNHILSLCIPLWSDVYSVYVFIALYTEYAQVVRMLGNGRLEAYCFDGVTRLGHIRGKMRKKVWVGAGDIILVSLREYQDGKVDIIHKYNADEARSLKAYGELPDNARINETAVDMAMEGDGEDDIGFDFDDI